MEFFEFLVVFFTAFVLPVTVIRTILEHKRKRMELERQSGEGLRLGELKALLAEVVREANEPLVERLEALEVKTFGQATLPEHEDGFDDEEFDDEFEEFENDRFEGRSAERTLGRRTRD